MTVNQYDSIIIGAGHNGLVAAAYLAKAKKKVLVLERRPIVGGSVVTESFGEGFNVDSVWTGGSLRPDIVKDLKLPLPGASTAGPDTAKERRALDPLLTVRLHGAMAPRDGSARPALISLLDVSRNAIPAYENHLVLDSDSARAAESIKRFSERDAARWPEFVRFMNKAAYILDAAYATLMPHLPRNFSLEEGYGLLELGLELRLAGRKDMLNFIRALPMTAQELAEEYFESEQVKAAIASVAIHGVTLGPMGAGTGYTLIHNWLNRGGLSHSNVGKAGEITQALAETVNAHGGDILINAEVKQVIVKNMRALGVVLANGEEISGKAILSAADPKHTLLKLVGAPELPPEFVWRAQSIKMRGSAAKVHLLTDGGHGIPEGTVLLAPSIPYLEKAYDAAKYGEISGKPYLEVTTAGNAVSIHFQYAPYALRDGSWSMQAGTVEKIAMDTLAEYFPNLKSSIVNRKSITPLDLETTYGLTEGDLNHGQLLLDQFLFMRPIPGWSNHKTPIDNLFLCGSGVHGGGGVSGAAGRNAARAVLRSR